MTSHIHRIAALVAAALIVAGCSGGSDRNAPPPIQQPPSTMQPPTQPPPPPPPQKTSFAGFVRQQLARTDVGGAPASVNEQDFEFDDTATSFDDLLQAAVED